MQYQLNRTPSKTSITIEDFMAMQLAKDEERKAKKQHMISIGLGLLGFMQARNQQPIEDKRSAVDAPALQGLAEDIDGFDFSNIDTAHMEDFAALVAKATRASATAFARGDDNNGKSGILGGASSNNNDMLLLLGAYALLSD
jgi:hypothetical protein